MDGLDVIKWFRVTGDVGVAADDERDAEDCIAAGLKGIDDIGIVAWSVEGTGDDDDDGFGCLRRHFGTVTRMIS